MNGGNWTQISRCWHEHPEWEQYGLDEELENCDHVIDTIEIVIDSVVVETIYTYEDTVQ